MSQESLPQAVSKRSAARPQASILLVEDDEQFAADLCAAARARGIAMEHFRSLEDLGYVGMVSSYAMVVLDYRLPALNGLEIAEYCAFLLDNRPVILISNNPPTEDARLSSLPNIRNCLHKGIGVEAIVNEIANQAMMQ